MTSPRRFRALRALGLASLGAAAIAGAPARAEGPAPTPGRVIVIGVDGASWNRLDPMLAAGELPNLARLRDRGVTARMATVKPVISPTVWTSIATGRGPDAHSVTGFLASTLDVRVPTAFERLAAGGLRVGLYDWLITWPPVTLKDGFVIPGWIRHDLRTTPPDVFARAGVAPYTWDADAPRTPQAFAAAARAEVTEKPERFVKLLRAYDPRVATVTFYCVDATSHRFWRAGYPEEFADGAGQKPDPVFGSVIHDAIVGVDRAIGTITAALAPEDHVIVVSDHGFQADQRGQRRIWVSHVEALEARAGLDPERDAFRANGFAFFVVRVLPGPFAEREATLVKVENLIHSVRTESGEPVYRLVGLDVAPRPPGSESTWRRRAEGLVLRAYLWWMGTRLDQPAHAYLIGVPNAAALDPLWPDGNVKLGDATVPIRELFHADDFTGTHDPEAVMFAGGPAIRHAEARVDTSVLDVAPLVFHLSGSAVPDDLEHPVRTDLLDAGWLAAHPVRTSAAASVATVAPPADPDAPRAESDEALKERLRALGYVK
jgi:hypothetical protein